MPNRYRKIIIIPEQAWGAAPARFSSCSRRIKQGVRRKLSQSVDEKTVQTSVLIETDGADVEWSSSNTLSTQEQVADRMLIMR